MGGLVLLHDFPSLQVTNILCRNNMEYRSSTSPYIKLECLENSQN